MENNSTTTTNNVISIEDKDKNSKKKKKIPAEVHWSRYIRTKGQFGVEIDQQGNPILYRFDDRKKTWIPCNDQTIKNDIWRFLAKDHPQETTNNNLINCGKVTTTEVSVFGRTLKKEKGVFISTNDAILEVLKDGRIKCRKKDDLFYGGKEFFCRTHIDLDLGTRANCEYYTTKSNEELERLGKEPEDNLFAHLINSSFPDIDTRRAFQEFFGDTLNSELRKAFPILIGDPDGGKSQILELALGLHSNSFGGDLSAIDGFHLESFVGKSLIGIDEISKTFNEKQFKAMIGGATIYIARKYQSSISVRPDWKFLGCLNVMPNFQEKSGALESRIYPFIVPKFTSKKIDEIANKIIKTQLNDVLDWALNGAVEVVKRGRILTHAELPASSKQKMKEVKINTNPAIEWIQDTGLKYCDRSLVSKDDIFTNFIDWCKYTNRNYLVHHVHKAVFFKDYFYPAMKDTNKNYDKSLERRPSVNGVSTPSCPVKFTNLGYKNNLEIEKSEVIRSYKDKSCYDDDNLPKHILEEIEEMNKIKKMEEEERKKYIDLKMQEEGYRKIRDDFGESWEKII